MDEEEQSRIHKLRQQLYSREYTPEQDKRTEISSKEVKGLHVDWKEAESKQKGNKLPTPRKEGFFVKWALILSVLFFLVSFAVVAYIFLNGDANISSKNVDIRILGPVAIGGGEELSLEIIVDNKNNADMESAVVFVEYPDGTRSYENLNEELLRDQQEYGPIGAGRNVRKSFKSILFGEQESVKEIKVVAEYRIQGSSATFKKEKNYEIQISSSPVLVNIEYPNQIRSDQDIEFIIEIVSNSSTDLNNLLFRAEYPYGFSFDKADPDPTFDTDIFSIGKLEPEEKKTIKIRGMLRAQDNEERTFRFNIGTESDTDEKELGAIYVSSSKTIAITKPSLGLTATINSSSSNEVVARSGQSVSTVISWFNNLTERIVNANVTARLSGSMMKNSSVVVDNGGFYRSLNRSVVWDQNTQSSLSEISPAEKGTVSFGFDVEGLTSSLGASMRNPEIVISVDIEGTRFSEGNVPEQVRTTLIKKVKIASDFNLSGRAVHATGPLENSGPIPPRANQETTYTIIWSLTNSYNDLKNVRAIAQLPAYVEWENIYTPNNENLSFNETTNQVIWEVANLPAGTGFNSSPKEVAFRVVMTPSISQVGTIPVIIQNTSAQGQDSFTGINLSDSVDPLVTNLTTDSGFTDDGAKVVQ